MVERRAGTVVERQGWYSGGKAGLVQWWKGRTGTVVERQDWYSDGNAGLVQHLMWDL